MTRYYWHRTCPLCKQGRLLVFKNTTSNELYLHCEECEWGWRDPETSDQKERGFLTLNEDFEAEPATWDDIAKHGWEQYAKNEFED